MESSHLDSLYLHTRKVYQIGSEMCFSEYTEFDNNFKLLQNATNNVYMLHGDKIPILFTLTEASLNYEHSGYNATTGFYANAMDSLRKILELIVFGIYFDQNRLEYADWLVGESVYGFKERLMSIFNFDEFTHWSPVSSSFKWTVLNLYKELSQFTHSNPTKWEQSMRFSSYLDFEKSKFELWSRRSKQIISYCLSMLLLYMPDIIDSGYDEVVLPQIYSEILNYRRI